MKLEPQISKIQFDNKLRSQSYAGFKKDDIVNIHGLVSAAKHNGKIGIVITEIDMASGRQ